MTQVLIYINPIDNKEGKLVINDLAIDYSEFKRLVDCRDDNDIIYVLEETLFSLDCTIEKPYGRLRMTNFPIYQYSLSRYFYYLIKLKNQIVYNKYLNILIKRHVDNLIYEYENPIETKEKNTKKKLPPNKFFKRVSKDLFTGLETYNYFNPRTKEEINSSNPDLLDELNCKKKKKVTKIKSGGIPISSMTFSFKINK